MVFLNLSPDGFLFLDLSLTGMKSGGLELHVFDDFDSVISVPFDCELLRFLFNVEVTSKRVLEDFKVDLFELPDSLGFTGSFFGCLFRVKLFELRLSCICKVSNLETGCFNMADVF